MFASLAFSLAATVAIVQQDPATTLVWGQVTSTGTGAPLSYAVVEVVAGGGAGTRVQTDSLGFYTLADVPAGRRLVRATHVDHAPHEVELIVASGQNMYVDFELDLRPVKLPTVLAQAGKLSRALRDTVSTTAPEIGPAAVKTLEATPGVAELGLADAAREAPVGQEPIDPSDVLFVRGAEADLKFVLLNGAPVHAPFHIGGLINALEPEIMRSATLQVGGASARYDGGLSYVMDLETRSGRPQRQRMDLGFDMLATRGVLEGPVGPSVSYLVSGRGVHGLGAKPFVGDPFPYAYGDVVGRIDIELPNGDMFSVTGFYNRENVQLDSVGTGDQIAEWGNTAGSVRYLGELLGAEALYTLAAGRFETELPVTGSEGIITRGGIERVRATADFTRPTAFGRIDYGTSFERLAFDYANISTADSTRVLTSDDTGYRDVAAVYIDGAVNPSSRLRLHAGLRADMFSVDGSRVRLAPRASATYMVSDRAALTLSAGRYRQYVRVPESRPAFDIEDEPASPPMRVARASHVVLSLDQDLGEAIRLDIEGYYKKYDDLPTVSGESAEASGIDLWVRRDAGALTGWFGYSLAWVWSGRDGDESTPEDFAGRHLVSVGLSGPMPGGSGFDVSIAYGAGLPFTAIPEPTVTTPVFSTGPTGAASRTSASSASSEPVPSVPNKPNERYLRVDARFARTFRGDWRGTPFELTPYLKVLNALDRRDAIFYHFDRAESNPQPRALADIPILPIIGVEWKF